VVSRFLLVFILKCYTYKYLLRYGKFILFITLDEIAIWIEKIIKTEITGIVIDTHKIKFEEKLFN
jgi:hypothetical protein